MTTGLPTLSAAHLEMIARGLKITSLVGGKTELWIPNEEQLEVWRAGEQHLRRFVTKARRVGISTCLDLEDALWTLNCDEAGHRVRCGVVLHTEKHLVERFVQMASFLRQLNIKCVALDTSITFPHGSEIFGITASATGASRSEGMQRVRWEELSFYKPGAFGEISPSVSIGAPEVIATTIDLGASNGKKAREIWRAPNGFAKIFLPMSRHHAYRAEPDLITDDQWQWMQKQGWSNRAAASYWLTEILPNKAEGDEVRAFREYPEREEHMFQSAVGRWCRKTPKVLAPIERVRVEGIAGAEYTLNIYKKPTDTSRDIAIGVDTAQGKGKDRSVVAVIDRVSRRLVACFASNVVDGDEAALVLKAAIEKFSFPDEYTGRMKKPRVFVEDNTVGGIIIGPARRLGLGFETFNTNAVTKYAGLVEARRAIESGILEGPKELAEEADELHRNDAGDFIGHKDILMACGFVYTRCPPLVHGPIHVEDVEKRITAKRMIERQMKRQRAGGW